jgi:zinc protease
MGAPLRLLAAVALILMAPPALALEVQRVLSPGGVEAWLVTDRSNPIISVSFAFRGGAALDPAGKEGLANMVSGLIDEGAGDLDSQAFQGRLEDMAIRLGFEAGRDTFSGSLRTLTENRDSAFRLLALALTKPRFDSEPVTRVKGQIQAHLRQDAENPNSIARRTLSRTLFPGHPYGRPVRGNKESVSAIVVDDLNGFVKRRLARDNLVIGVVGDIDAADLAPLLDSVFGGLPTTSAPGRVADTTARSNGATIVIRKPVPQSAVLFAQAGLKRNDPDYYSATVVNHILGGGGFTSRLYDQVREKRGLAYSVYSALYPLDHAALILGAAGTANESVLETLTLIRELWRDMGRNGVTEQELADAKTYITGSFPLRFTSNGAIASILIGMQLENLGIDYLDRRNSFIEAVTIEDANRVARRLYDADTLTVVVVGEPVGVVSEKGSP